MLTVNDPESWGTTNFKYDNAGRQTGVQDAMSNWTTFTLDRVGRTTAEQHSKGTRTAAYDHNGQLTSISNDANNGSGTFSIDAPDIALCRRCGFGEKRPRRDTASSPTLKSKFV